LELVAQRFAVLADPLRLRLVHALFEGERSVGELVAATGGSQTNVSRDLHLLAAAGVVARRKQGLRVYYSITDPTIFALCELVCAGLETALAHQAARLEGRGKREP
jgi:ArsR family transcriptional regulator